MLLENGLLVLFGLSSPDASTRNKCEYGAMNLRGTTWRRWLRYCPTRQKVAISTPDVVVGILIDLILPAA
jgi:hypothetical protein